MLAKFFYRVWSGNKFACVFAHTGVIFMVAFDVRILTTGNRKE